MSYNDEVPSGQGLDGLAGFHVKKAGAQHSTQFLNFGNPTIFRIMPEISERGQEMPWRLGEGQGQFSGWIKGVRMAVKMGINGRFTCFANVLGREPRHEGPLDLFSKTVYDAMDRSKRAYPEEWEEWTTYSKRSGLKLPKIDYYALVQCLLFEHGGKRFTDSAGNPQPKHPVILCLKTSARYALQDVCNQERAGFGGNPEDYDSRYLIGDAFSLSGGHLLRFIPVEDDGKSRSHYELEVLSDVVPLPDEVAAEWQPWDKLLEFLTEEQQLSLIVEHFPPEIVDFVFGRSSYTEMLPKHIRGSYHRSTRPQIAVSEEVAVPRGYGLQTAAPGQEFPSNVIMGVGRPRVILAPAPTPAAVSPSAEPRRLDEADAVVLPERAPRVGVVNFGGGREGDVKSVRAPESAERGGQKPRSTTPPPPAPGMPEQESVPLPPRVPGAHSQFAPAVEGATAEAFERPAPARAPSQPLGDPGQTPVAHQEAIRRLRAARERTDNPNQKG